MRFHLENSGNIKKLVNSLQTRIAASARSLYTSVVVGSQRVSKDVF